MSEDSRVKVWSYSRLTSLSSCSKKYQFKYIDRLDLEFKGFNLIRGNLVHEIVQNALSVLPADITDEYIKKAIFLNCTVEDLADHDIEKDIADIRKAGELLAAEVKKIALEKLGENPELKVEENIKFEVKKKNGQVGGIMTTYLDIHLWKGKKHVVIELKTTAKTPSGGEASLSHQKQAIIYNEGLKSLYGEYAESLDYFIIYAVILKKEIKILPIKIDFASFAFYDDVITELWNLIRTANELEQTNSFACALSDQICSWCDFRHLCLEGKSDGLKQKEEFKKENS